MVLPKIKVPALEYLGLEALVKNNAVTPDGNEAHNN